MLLLKFVSRRWLMKIMRYYIQYIKKEACFSLHKLQIWLLPSFDYHPDLVFTHLFLVMHINKLRSELPIDIFFLHVTKSCYAPPQDIRASWVEVPPGARPSVAGAAATRPKQVCLAVLSRRGWAAVVIAHPCNEWLPDGGTGLLFDCWPILTALCFAAATVAAAVAAVSSAVVIAAAGRSRRLRI